MLPSGASVPLLTREHVCIGGPEVAEVYFFWKKNKQETTFTTSINHRFPCLKVPISFVPKSDTRRFLSKEWGGNPFNSVVESRPPGACVWLSRTGRCLASVVTGLPAVLS